MDAPLHSSAAESMSVEDMAQIEGIDWCPEDLLRDNERRGLSARVGVSNHGKTSNASLECSEHR